MIDEEIIKKFSLSAKQDESVPFKEMIMLNQHVVELRNIHLISKREKFDSIISNFIYMIVINEGFEKNEISNLTLKFESEGARDYSYNRLIEILKNMGVVIY